MNLLEQATTQPSEPDYSKTYSDEHGEYRYIKLTQGQSTRVDVADFDWLNQWKWYAAWSDKMRSYYVLRQQRISRTDDGESRQKTVRMHRAIMGEPPNKIDHKDCDPLNNRRYNIRNANNSQNGANRVISRRSTTGFKGVSRYVRHGQWTGQWRSQITKDKIRRHIGYFSTPEAAHAAYVAKAKELHGEFFHAG